MTSLVPGHGPVYPYMFHILAGLIETGMLTDPYHIFSLKFTPTTELLRFSDTSKAQFYDHADDKFVMTVSFR